MVINYTNDCMASPASCECGCRVKGIGLHCSTSGLSHLLDAAMGCSGKVDSAASTLQAISSGGQALWKHSMADGRENPPTGKARPRCLKLTRAKDSTRAALRKSVGVRALTDAHPALRSFMLSLFEGCLQCSGSTSSHHGMVAIYGST